MSKTLCKGIRKDGSPCRGNALDQYDGYCIAHGPAPDQAHEWRSLGGKNSATAARLDKRIPERLKSDLDMVGDAMLRVLQGTLNPSALSAICRGAKTRIDLYRLADEEMEDIRAEELHTAAAQVVGDHGNLDILKKAEEIAALHNQQRVDSLIAQGLAESKQEEWDKPEQVVLTPEGLDRFDHRFRSDYTQEDIDDRITMEESYRHRIDIRQSARMQAQKLRDELEEALEDLEHGPEPEPPPLDPVTGRYMTEIPAGVSTGYGPDPDPDDVEFCPETLTAQILQCDNFLLELEKLEEPQVNHIYRDHGDHERDPHFMKVRPVSSIAADYPIEKDIERRRELDEFLAKQRILEEEEQNGQSG
ncbi:MAG: hypothetical protein OXF54_16405 [Caldilineaceae bacterium]|nr:hypothetical protein [Caldilineaceae bacterium]